MDVKNLSWEQIKELAEIAIKNGSDFSLTLCADGDCSLDISKHDYCGGEQNVTTTTRTETISPYRDTLTIKLGEPVKCESGREGTDPMTRRDNLISGHL